MTSPVLVRRLIRILETLFADTAKARRLRRDGSYERIRATGSALRAQERFYLDAVETTRDARGSQTGFRPLGRPDE